MKPITTMQGLAVRWRIENKSTFLPWLTIALSVPIFLAGIVGAYADGEACTHPTESALVTRSSHESCVAGKIAQRVGAAVASLLAILALAPAIGLVRVRTRAKRRLRALHETHAPMLRQIDDWYVNRRIARDEAEEHRERLGRLARGEPGRVAETAGAFMVSTGVVLLLGVILWTYGMGLGSSGPHSECSGDDQAAACGWWTAAEVAYVVALLAVAVVAVLLLAAGSPLHNRGRADLKAESDAHEARWADLLERANGRLP